MIFVKCTPCSTADQQPERQHRGSPQPSSRATWPAGRRARLAALQRALPVVVRAQHAHEHGGLGEVLRRLHAGHGDEPGSAVLQARERIREHLPDGLVDPAAPRATHRGRPPRGRFGRARTPASRGSARPRRGAPGALRLLEAQATARRNAARGRWSTSATEAPNRSRSCAFADATLPLALQRAGLGEVSPTVRMPT